MIDTFYKNFEDKYRGDRDLIKSRLQVYLPFVRPLLEEKNSNNLALDLACGRGEWLELLKEQGFIAQGVDIDDRMLTACHQLGLKTVKADALEHLQSFENESIAVVSSFHFVEHISFDKLKALIEQAFRVLKPGGLLILETQNPENIVVGATTFYIDPTHKQPLPPQLLSFTAEYAGFERVKILRLQEKEANNGTDIGKSENISLINVLYGVSPDYSVVAQKQAVKPDSDRLDNLFSKEYGLSLDKLASLYDEKLNSKIDNLTKKAEQLHTELCAVYNSSSWKITAPLRWFVYQVRLLRQHGPLLRIKALIKKITHPFIMQAITFIDSHAGLRFWLVKVVKKLGLYNMLRAIYFRLSRGRYTGYGNVAVPKKLQQLTPRARRIYAELTDAIAKQQKEKR